MLNSSPELVLKILDMLSIPLSFPKDDPANQHALAACSLVCKGLATHSQRLLFRRVSIDSQCEGMVIMFYGQRPTARPISRVASFLSTITADTDESRWLRDSVVSLVLRPRASTKPSDTIAILTNLPNLRELELSGRACIFNDAELGPITSMGTPAWPYIPELTAVFPTICMLDITSNSVQQLPLFEPSPSLPLVSVKFSSKWVVDASPCVASLLAEVAGEHLQLFYQTQSMQPADLHGILVAHEAYLRSLASESFPSGELVAAIPRTITALAVGSPPPSLPPAPSRILAHPRLQAPLDVSANYLIQQLDTFANLKAFTWVGPTVHTAFVMLQKECNARGIEFRSRTQDSVRHLFALYRLRSLPSYTAYS
ncbi:hypothetical protein FB451DRAFT_1493211 [Mycena latifolia]|nr:hypothetical protein FB451DRAFT_1493211 [Mycena latifolia]